MSIEISSIDISHVRGFRNVLDTVARERKFLPAFEAPPPSSVHDFVENNIRLNRPQFVALDDAKVVGWCDILQREEPIRQHIGVLGIGLLPDYRSQGIGRRILATTLQESVRQGLVRIELKVRASNEAAIRLFEWAGFNFEGTLKNDVLMDGQFESTHCMALFATEFD